MYVASIIALTAVVMVAYVVLCRRRQEDSGLGGRAQRRWKRTTAVAAQLRDITEQIRQDLLAQEPNIAMFKQRVAGLGGQEDAAWQDVLREVESMLQDLGQQIARGYEELRQQSRYLMSFAESRTDPLTGVSNRKALEEMLHSSFTLLSRHHQPFALAVLDIDHFKKINDQQGHPYGDLVLHFVAQLSDKNTRENDMVARYGGEEFVIVMPHTGAAGACVCMEKLRRLVARSGLLTISAGVASAVAGDNTRTLLARADDALYAAKAAGRDRVFRHTGSRVEAWSGPPQGPPPDSIGPPREERGATTKQLSLELVG